MSLELKAWVGDRGEVRVCSVIDGVPYYGGGDTLREAFARFCDVVADHGAPVPGGSLKPDKLLAALDEVKQRINACTVLDPNHVTGSGDEAWVPAPDVVAKIHAADEAICAALDLALGGRLGEGA